MFHHVSSNIFIQTWGTRKSNGLFVSGFPLLVFFSSDVRYTMVYLISGQSQVKSMLLTYCAPHCVGSGFCVGSACLIVVTLSETKSTNYIYIYHHISHIITYIYITLYIYIQQNQAIVPIATVFDASVAVVAAACAAAVAAAASAAAFAASRSVAAGFASATGWWPPSPKPWGMGPHQNATIVLLGPAIYIQHETILYCIC